jgi:hypothetical protein
MSRQFGTTHTRLAAGMLWLALSMLVTLGAAWADDSQRSGWGRAQRLDATDYGQAPVVATDARGDAISVWVQYDVNSSQYGLWARRYVPGDGWKAAERVNDPAGQPDRPALAMNDRGEAMAVWAQFGIFDINNPGPVNSSLWASRFVPGKGWSKPMQLEGEATNPNYAVVTMDQHGNAIAAWNQTNVAHDVSNVYANRYVAGAGWGRSQLLQDNKDKKANSIIPQLAMNADGDALVAWTRFDPVTYVTTAEANRYQNGRGWSGQETIVGSEAGGNPLVGLDGRGNAMAVWTRMDPTTYQTNVFASRYGVRSGWDKAELLQPGTDIDANNLRFAMNDSGQAIALWKETIAPYFSDFTWEMHANRFTPGRGWSGSQQVGSTATQPIAQMNAQIGMDARGNAIAVWEFENIAAQTDPYSQVPTNVYAFRFAAGRGWDAGTALQKGTANGSNAQVAVSAKGDAFATWQEQDNVSGATSLWANHYSMP